MHTLALRDGTPVPALGLGTWKAAPGEVGPVVELAIELGYRHIDCAAIYANEAEIGEALARCFARGLVQRNDLWITSKLWNHRHEPERVVDGIRQTLSDLRLDHLDLYLMHWPVAHRHDVVIPEDGTGFLTPDDCPIEDTWSAMLELVSAGLTRQVGVSNFSAKKVRVLAEASGVAPAMNQVELHPYLQQSDLLDTCRELGARVTAYSPLGSPDRPDRMRQEDEPVLMADPALAEIAAAHDATPAQVLIRWAMQRDTFVIPKSVQRERLEQNLAAAELTLTDSDMASIRKLDRHRRYIDGVFWTTPGSPYNLTNLWDEG